MAAGDASTEASQQPLKREKLCEILKQISYNGIFPVDTTVPPPLDECKTLWRFQTCGSEDLETDYWEVLATEKHKNVFAKGLAVCRTARPYRWRTLLESDDFHEAVRNVYTAVDLNTLPSTDWLSKTGDAALFQRRLQVEQRLRADVRKITAVQGAHAMFVNGVSSLMNDERLGCGANLVTTEGDTKRMALKFYLKALEDNLQDVLDGSLGDNSNNASPQSVKSYGSLSYLTSVVDALRPHVPSNEEFFTDAHRFSFKAALLKLKVLARQLMYFDAPLLFARLRGTAFVDSKYLNDNRELSLCIDPNGRDKIFADIAGRFFDSCTERRHRELTSWLEEPVAMAESVILKFFKLSEAPPDALVNEKNNFLVKTMEYADKDVATTTDVVVDGDSCLAWLFEQCSAICQQERSTDAYEMNRHILDLMAGVMDILLSASAEAGAPEQLVDLVGFSKLDFVTDVLKRREGLTVEFSRRAGELAAAEVLEQAESLQLDAAEFGSKIAVYTTQGRARLREERRQLKRAKEKGALSIADIRNGGRSTIEILEALGTASFAAQEATTTHAAKGTSKLLNFFKAGAPRDFLETEAGYDWSAMGMKRTLPAGTRHFKSDDDVVETYEIPAPQHKKAVDPEELISIADLPAWAQVAFPGIEKLNPIQSAVYHAAFQSGDSFLLSAPTGAGKTNVALLAILQQLQAHMNDVEQIESAKTFKIVYIAPMKSLVAEISQKYAAALGPLGIVVQELTADMPLTRKQVESVHLIVTVPEKWDVLTRSFVQGGVGGENSSLISTVACLVIDEIHLLNDLRGPVIESIVARTLRFGEMQQRQIRIVGISATLPNWTDIAAFIRAKHVFHFSESYRPIPLKQSFVGINLADPSKRIQKFNEVCFEHVAKCVEKDHQILVFVHSRTETVSTALALVEAAKEAGRGNFFGAAVARLQHRSEFGSGLKRARDRNLGLLWPHGIAIHHAGMVRGDRNLVEAMFRKGAVSVLCCTSTLAWGVNLPARCVIIKGTNVYCPTMGKFRDLGILDVFQIFGRAGRPQYDTEGHAILLTEHSRLHYFISRTMNQIPIESQFLTNIANALNAEIAAGTVTNETEGSQWLQCTYLYVRMLKAPQQYGISLDDLVDDPYLHDLRRTIVIKAAEALEEARFIRISTADFSFYSTELGRVAARFYIDWETARTFHSVLENGALDDSHILMQLGRATEFSQLKTAVSHTYMQLRPEDDEELSSLAHNCCLVRPLEAPNDQDNTAYKVSVLFQTYLSRMTPESGSLLSDMFYIQQNAARLLRAMFSMAIASPAFGAAGTAERLLEWAKMAERRIWDRHHVLRHFCYPNVFDVNAAKRAAAFGSRTATDDNKKILLKENTVKILEKLNIPLWRLYDYSKQELANLVRVPADAGTILSCLAKVPNVALDLRVQPVTSSIMKLTLQVKAEFKWTEKLHGASEPFVVWVEKPTDQTILHYEEISLPKTSLNEPLVLTFTLPFGNPEDTPPQYLIKLVSSRWVNVAFQEEFSVRHLLLPDRRQLHTPLLDLHPLPITALQDSEFEKLYTFSHFNPIQTQCFHVCYHTPFNVLLGAPTGSGKTIVAELALLALFRQRPEQTVVYVAPLKALAKERLRDWKIRLEKQLGKRVVELTGDAAPDISAIQTANVIITTPEKWDGVSRHWRKRAYVQKVGLIIIDEIHLLGLDRGPILEVIVSRMRYISTSLDTPIRFVGLSTALANAHDIADWLGIGKVGLFNFKPSVRPVPCVTHINGFPGEHYCPRMAAMNKPAYKAIKSYSFEKAVLIFVSSRRQTRLTALDLMGLCAADDNPRAFLHVEDAELFERFIDSQVKDATLKRTLVFGIGMHHAGLVEADRNLSEKLFKSGQIQILVATSTLAWGVNLPAHLVIVKGTEYYDGRTHKYVDMPITDVLQMIGRAGRPQFDDSAVACIFVQEKKKSYYKHFLYEPFPVESCLATCLDEHINAEIYGGTICTRNEALEYLSWTYLFRRLTANPFYYNSAVAGIDEAPDQAFQDFSLTGKRSAHNETDVMRLQREQIAAFVESLVDKCIRRLLDAECIELSQESADVILGLEDSDSPALEDGPTPDGALQPDPPQVNVVAARGALSYLRTTWLGAIASIYYISITTTELLKKVISRKKRLSFVECLNLLSECDEFAELPVRHNEDQLNLNLAQLCPIAIDQSRTDSPHVKCQLLLQAHFFGVTLPITDYITDLKSVLDQSIRVVQAMLRIATFYNSFETTQHCILLLQCIAQGSSPYKSTLFTLPHMSESMRSTLEERHQIQHLAQFIELPIQDQEKVIQGLSPNTEIQNSMITALRNLPRLRINIAVETSMPDSKRVSQWAPVRNESRSGSYKFVVQEGSRIRVSVTLKYINHVPTLADLPRFTKKKAANWICLLKEKNFLVDFKTVGNLGKSRARSVRFELADSARKPSTNLTICVMSDTFLGIDQEFPLELT